MGAKEFHTAGVAERRREEGRIWQRAFIGSLLFHLLVFLLAPLWPMSVPLTTAAGDRSPDSSAPEGVMVAVAMSSAPPDPATPPPIPLPAEAVPEPEVIRVEASPEVTLEVVEVPDPGVGLTVGDAPNDAPDPGITAGTGSGGGGGDALQGPPRRTPPSPRGLIIPPTNRELRGSEIEVWVFVNEAGRVVPDSTQLRPPTSNRGFNDQLTREAAQWIFEPAREGGVPVASWFPYIITMD